MTGIASIFMLVLVAITAVTVWLVVSIRRSAIRAALGGPVCGACGYSVIGLTTLTCPECGTDLRAAGILTPRTPRPNAGIVGAVIVFTVLLGLVALIVTPALLSILPLRRSYAQQVRLITPNSGAYREVILRTQGSTWGTGRIVLPVTIELPPTAQPATTAATPSAAKSPPASMTVRPDGGYEYVAPGAPRIQRATGFGVAAVLDWMRSAGLDTTKPIVRDEAARIAGELRIVSRGGRRAFSSRHLGAYSSSSSGTDSGGQFASRIATERGETAPPAWLGILIAVVWILTWISGLRHLARRSQGYSNRPPGM
jgi:hypothetical protein